MACLRCILHPVVVSPPGLRLPYELRPGSPRLDLTVERDVELEHAEPATGTFLAVAQPPAGYGRPRICSLCGVVYYPRVS